MRKIQIKTFLIIFHTGTEAQNENFYLKEILVTHFTRKKEQKGFQHSNIIKTIQPTLKSLVQTPTTTGFEMIE